MAGPPAEVLAAARPGRSPLKILVRIVIGLAVVALLIARTPDRAALVDALTTADRGWGVAAAGALFVGIAVSAMRWRAYLDALELSMPFPTVLRLYFVGTFFNAFLPSGIGGDAYKAVRVGRGIGEGLTHALASVFLDRFAGFVGLAVVGLTGVVVELFRADEDFRVAQVAFVLSSGMVLAALGLLVGGERLLGPRRLIGETGVGGKLRTAVRAIQDAARHPNAAARGYAFGFLFQLLVLTYHVLAARALGVTQVSVPGMAGVVVVASLATLIPLSPGGLGFREAAYVWALRSFGVPESTALAFALVIFAILLATSAVGGVVYVAAGGEVGAGRNGSE